MNKTVWFNDVDVTIYLYCFPFDPELWKIINKL